MRFEITHTEQTCYKLKITNYSCFVSTHAFSAIVIRERMKDFRHRCFNNFGHVQNPLAFKNNPFKIHPDKLENSLPIEGKG